MKQLVVVLITLTGLFLESCEPTATSNQPQPANTSSLVSFPQRLQGNFVAAGQASLITITDKLIIRHYYEFKMHKDSLFFRGSGIGGTNVDY